MVHREGEAKPEVQEYQMEARASEGHPGRGRNPVHGRASCKKYPETPRLVRFHELEQDGDYAFPANAFRLPALKVTNLYRNHWQVELFFTWRKQHLGIKRLWGMSENAVRIQAGVAAAAFRPVRL